MYVDENIVGENIRRFRLERKMTQQKLADLAGLNVAHLQQYEYGTRHPKNEQLVNIAKALNVLVACLVLPRATDKDVLAAFFYDLHSRIYGMKITEHDGNVCIEFPRNFVNEETCEDLLGIKRLVEEDTGRIIEQLQEGSDEDPELKKKLEEYVPETGVSMLEMARWEVEHQNMLSALVVMGGGDVIKERPF